MPRQDVTPAVAAAAQSNLVRLAYLVDLTLANTVEHIWSGPGDLVWNGITYTGIGDLGQVGAMTEGTEVEAAGTSITLSGIDNALLAESLNDIQQRAPCAIWLAMFDENLNIIPNPVKMCGLLVDKPDVEIGTETCSITIALESRMLQLQRGQQRRLSQADQMLQYPTDCSMSWIESLNDIALRWNP